MSDGANGWPAPGTRYGPHEIELLRAQARRGHADARAELERRGHGIHPRVAALKAEGKWPGSAPLADRRDEGRKRTMSGWTHFAPNEDNGYGRLLWLAVPGETPILAQVDEDGTWIDTGSGARVGASGGTYPSLCREVEPPVSPGSVEAGLALPEGATLVGREDFDGPLGGHCIGAEVDGRFRAIAAGLSSGDADRIVGLWNAEVAQRAGS